MEGRTVSLEDATLYVFKAWVDSKEWKVPPLHLFNWVERRRQWEEEGVWKADQERMEAELVAGMIRKLPVFVLKGLGAYYSATQLKYATGTSSHVVDLYRYLRDSKRKGGREKEAEEADEDSGFDLGGNLPMGGAGTGGAPDPSLLRAIGFEVPAQLGGPSGEGPSSGAVTVRSVSGGRQLGVHFGELCSHEREPQELARVVVRAALSEGLAVEEAMNRAVYQYEAAGGDHLALRRNFVSILADTLNDAPALPSAAGMPERTDDQGRSAAQGLGPGSSSESGGKGVAADKAFEEGVSMDEVDEETEKWGEEEEGEGEGAEGESDEDESRDIDLEADDEGMGPRWLYEKEGRETYGPIPVQGLGDMGRGFWEDFDIPDEAVMMQTNFDAKLAEKYASKNNLWKASVLSKFLPVTIPFSTPAEEVFFSEGFVRAAIPGIQDHGRSLSVQALHVSEGAPLESTDHATSEQLRRLVWRRRRESGPEEIGDDALQDDDERACKRGLLRDKDLLAERAQLEVSIAGLEYKRQKRE